VDSKDILLDLDFEGTMKKLYAKDVEAAQAKANAATTSTPSVEMPPNPTP
jgi:hypothetical protein